MQSCFPTWNDRSFLAVPFIHACEERGPGKCSGGSRCRWISRALSSTFCASCWEFEDEIHLPGDTTTGTGTAVSVTWRDWYYFDTSSAAQGGGRSFKNWKPIGDVGCCESRMEEQRHYGSTGVSGFLSFYLFLVLTLSIYLSIYSNLF